MTFDNLMALIAPFRCLFCERTGWLVCPDCQKIEYGSYPSRCYRCHKATLQFQVCTACRRSVALGHVWVSTTYEDVAKKLLEAFKFERAMAAGKDIGDIMADQLPLLAEDVLVCPLPTAPGRVRARGYDQAVVLAKRVARRKGLKSARLLKRVSSSRQVGSDRSKRITQAAKAFTVSGEVGGGHVLLVDDVTTSGATLEAAAKMLKKAGAKTIDAVVFAQALD